MLWKKISVGFQECKAWLAVNGRQVLQKRWSYPLNHSVFPLKQYNVQTLVSSYTHWWGQSLLSLAAGEGGGWGVFGSWPYHLTPDLLPVEHFSLDDIITHETYISKVITTMHQEVLCLFWLYDSMDVTIMALATDFFPFLSQPASSVRTPSSTVNHSTKVILHKSQPVVIHY